MSEDQQDSIQFRLGQLSGQVTALSGQVTSLTTTIASMDNRLRHNENVTAQLSTKMGAIGIIAGGVGSFAVTLLLKFLKF